MSILGYRRYLDLKESEGLITWLKHRVIPKNRAFVDEILYALGSSHNDTKGIIDISKGMSLNDSYWMVRKAFTTNSQNTTVIRIHFQRY